VPVHRKGRLLIRIASLLSSGSFLWQEHVCSSQKAEPFHSELITICVIYIGGSIDFYLRCGEFYGFF
jgi:hypothetical protein